MKRIIVLLAFIVLGNLTLIAQAPPSPPSTGNNSGSNGFVGGSEGGSAPIGNGTFILMALAAIYAGRKVYVVQVDHVRE